jgi:hypothetical protein
MATSFADEASTVMASSSDGNVQPGGQAPAMGGRTFGVGIGGAGVLNWASARFNEIDCGIHVAAGSSRVATWVAAS